MYCYIPKIMYYTIHATYRYILKIVYYAMH